MSTINLNPNASHKQESDTAKIVSLVVKLGALFFIIGLPTQYAINLQLLGGIWIIQTLPAVFLGLYLGWLRAGPLLLGWASGIAAGTWMFIDSGNKTSYPITLFGTTVPCYDALSSLVLNLAVAIVLSTLLNFVSRGPLAASRTAA